MNLSILRKQNDFPLLAMKRLENQPLDYQEKHSFILSSNSQGARHLEAGVVLLLYFNGTEFCFQLIKRSQYVAQAGDISCPGGILEKSTDTMLSHILAKTGFIRRIDNTPLCELPHTDKVTKELIAIYLMNALRESWEEIGLSPLNVVYLGSLPSYSLTFFERTIFPVVCLIKEPYRQKPSHEVEKILEIPLGRFFDSSSYARLTLTQSSDESDLHHNITFPCMVIPGDQGHEDILWGATFHIVTNFLQIVYGAPMPFSTSSRTILKTIPQHYATGLR
ncbi:MAG TPA: CoA pyrophosphatase [Smithellaceae bacterium]|jgi:8-oxo-dGTP pyrophosphatase MutT (NUDIX family)|nr:CoA pyrophosphatase [Syntrophaceae bacterium]HPV49506.1 CoA pyrophosphatase [Smithellaceae bacterium]